MGHAGSRRIVVVDAPSSLGLRPPRPGVVPGAREAPAALRAAGLLAAVGGEDGGAVPVAPYDFALDPALGVRNVAALRDLAERLAARVGQLLDEGRFPLVVGGDCGILLGPTLALRRRGRHGLVFVDGHSDFQRPSDSRTGGAAGMDCAIVTGHGIAELADVDGLAPYVREGDAWIIGNRDIDDRTAYYAPLLFETAVHVVELHALRTAGIDAALAPWRAWLAGTPVEGVWLHVDVDVLDSDRFGAVDSPQPDGLAPDELVALLRAVLDSGRVVGMDVTIYDPTLDPTRAQAALLVDILRQVLRGGA